MNITRNPFTGSPLGSAAFLGSSSFSVVPNNDHNTIPPQQPRAFAPAAFDPFFGAADDATALAVQQQQQEQEQQQHQPLLETPQECPGGWEEEEEGGEAATAVAALRRLYASEGITTNTTTTAEATNNTTTGARSSSSPLSSANSRGSGRASTPSTTPMRGGNGNDDDQEEELHDDDTDHHVPLLVESLVTKIQSVVMDEVVPTLRLRIGEEVRSALLPLVHSRQMKSSGAAPKPAVGLAAATEGEEEGAQPSSAQPHTTAAELEAAADDDDDHRDGDEDWDCEDSEEEVEDEDEDGDEDITTAVAKIASTNNGTTKKNKSRPTAIPLAELIAKARKELPGEEEKEENQAEGRRKSRRNRKSSKAMALITIDTHAKKASVPPPPLAANPSVLVKQPNANPTTSNNNVEAQFNAIAKRIYDLPAPQCTTRDGRLYIFRPNSPSGTPANGGGVLVNVDYHMQCFIHRDLGYCPGRSTTCRKLHLSNDEVDRLCCYAIATGRGYVKFCRKHTADPGSCRATECRMFHGSFEQLTQRDANLDRHLVPNHEFCNQPTQCWGKCHRYHDPALMKLLCQQQQQQRGGGARRR